MIVKYGTYSFADNELALSITKRPVHSDRGIREYTRETWAAQGVMHAASQAALTTALAALRAALVDGYDLSLYLDDGTTLTDHYVTNSATKGGVRVTALDFPVGTGAEYSKYRSYSITWEADFYNTAITLLDFNEEINVEGTGGARRIFIETLEGPPVEQIVNQRTTYRATQSGSAVGLGVYPSVPGPLWPFAEHLPLRRKAPKSPRRTNTNLLEYGISWGYVFESTTPLVGNPNAL